MSKRSNSLVKNTLILSFGTFCTKGIMFVMSPLITRWLTQAEYGDFDVLHTYASLLLPVLTLSNGESIFRFLLDINDEEERKKLLSTAATIDFVGIIVALILSFILNQFYGLDRYVAIAFSFYFCTDIIYNYLKMSMRGIKQLKVYTVSNIAYVLGMSVFAFLFAKLFRFGLPGLLCAYGMGNVISIFIMLFKSKIYKYIRFSYSSLNTFKRIVQYSLPMIPNAISWWIVNVSDRTIIKIYLGSEYNAIYAIANKIPALCTTFFSVFHLSWQQNASETLNDNDRDGYYSNIFNKMITIVGSITICIVSINYWFFVLLYRENYFPGYYHAPLLALAVVFSMMGQFIGGIYVAQKETKKNGFTTVCAAVINITVNIVLIGYIGLYAASVSTLIAYISLFIIRFIDIKKTINLKFEGKTIFMFLLLLVFVVMSYFDVFIFKILMPIIGIIFFIFINYQLVFKYSKQLLGKFKR